MNFIEHAKKTFNKVADTIRQLGYILANLGGTKESWRRLLKHVAISRLIYGAPNWEPNMGMTAWKILDVVHRRIRIKRISVYRSVSYAAVAMVVLTQPRK